MTALAVANRLGLDPYAVAAKASLSVEEFAEWFGISFTEAAAAKADLAPPAAPTGVAATVTSPTEVSIAFAAPGATGIGIVSSPSITLTYDVNDVTSPVPVTGAFASGVAYTFTMTAANANGSSAASAASAAVTPNP